MHHIFTYHYYFRQDKLPPVFCSLMNWTLLLNLEVEMLEMEVGYLLECILCNVFHLVYRGMTKFSDSDALVLCTLK